MAIGQGFNLVTPLQMCSMTATLANGGKLYRPQLIEQVIDPEGKIIETFSPELVSEITGLEQYFNSIRRGMEEVVNWEGFGEGNHSGVARAGLGLRSRWPFGKASKR